MLYLLGLDFYTYSNREIVGVDKDIQFLFIRDQFVFSFIIYLILAPLIVLIFYFNIIDIKYILYFYFILIFEYMSQEFYRFFTILKKPLLANFLFFIRTGLWVYAIFVFYYFKILKNINLKVIWLSWLIGAFLSVIIAIFCLKKEYNFKLIASSINWNWIKNGVKISFPFFVGTICYKIIEFSDRYMIDYFLGKEKVGIYTFFKGIANVQNMIIFTIVIMIIYPLMVETYKKNDFKKFDKLVKRFRNQVWFYSIITWLGIFIFIKPVLNFINKQSMFSYIDLLWLLMIGNIVLNLSYIPHYILYVKHKDIVIRNATIVGALLNIILNLILIKFFGIYGAAFATIVSFGYIGIHKKVRI